MEIEDIEVPWKVLEISVYGTGIEPKNIEYHLAVVFPAGRKGSCSYLRAKAEAFRSSWEAKGRPLSFEMN